MKPGAEEVEVKFHVERLREIEQLALQRGARLISPRTHETNLRFDTPDRSLSRGRRVLRLRQASSATLTYKGPGALNDGVRIRPEFEVQVSDLHGTLSILESLGYEVVFKYEKYRTTYKLGDVELMLDELPFGDFVELEGSLGRLKPAAQVLSLRWEAAVPDSYHMLYEKLRSARQLAFRDLTFRNFAEYAARLEELGVTPADSQDT